MFEVFPKTAAWITQASFNCLLNEDWDHLGLWHMLNYFTEVRFQIKFYVNIRTCLLVWNCLCSLNFATAALMKKTCADNKKCLSFSPRFSLPAPCKLIVLIFKINFLWFWPPEPENRFPVFFENEALLAKTNHIRFLVLPIPIYVQNMKKKNRFFDFCRRMLDV